MKVNRLQKSILSEKIIKFFDGDVKGKTIAMWGLAFKPNTDDIREAPALFIIDDLLKAGAKVKVFDPEAMDNVRKEYNGKITFAENQYEALENADVLAIVTEWSVFRTPDFDKVRTSLSAKAIFDGRNLYDTDKMVDKGIHYESIGRLPIVYTNSPVA